MCEGEYWLCRREVLEVCEGEYWLYRRCWRCVKESTGYVGGTGGV